MSSTTVSLTTSTSTSSSIQPLTRLHPYKTGATSRSLRRPTASTPNLNLVYTSQSTSRLAPPVGLSRKTSFAALTPSSLASIPDVSESYAYESVSLLTADRPNSRMSNGIPDITMAPSTPRRPIGDNLSVGDIVDVPGGMHGTVRFVGSVQGKKGLFAGVELHADHASKGKNNGEVDGISYFNTINPGAGIFVPATKALRRGSPIPSIPMTPSASGLRSGFHNASGRTPSTPGLPKFSASVGPGTRAPSPGGKRPPRNSLPRPESPIRRTQMTPGPRPSMGQLGKTPSRFGSPTNRFAQSVRGTSGDPNKNRLGADRKFSIGPRSHSALGSTDMFDDDAATPVPRSKTSGSVGSVSSFSAKVRPASRANGRDDEELERLRAQLEDRERQLKDQSATLVEMETSLTELQSLMENAEGLGGPPRRNSIDDKDSGQLRHLVREKNEKIAMLTAEFDAHRADFRSTIDALEMASTETERVYEKRIEELMADIRDLESRNMDVDSVATQLRQLEELVQELEEGLEDARRGEAEARGEVEFLRGEVERTRTELRREREKAGNATANNGEASHTSKELEQKEDEIRGLKAIIHSLSRDSIPNDDRSPRSPIQRRTSTPNRPGSWIPNEMAKDILDVKIARDNLERQVAELQGILEQKNKREDEMEKELDKLRSSNNAPKPQRSSLRDSRDTVVLSRVHEAQSSESHKRGGMLDTMAESDAHSDVTANSTLWCEICETSGHDILTCTNMFGPDGAKMNGEVAADVSKNMSLNVNALRPHNGDDMPAPLSPARSKSSLATTTVKILPNPMESGPVAGKESGVVDTDKWCAVCERDGHDSVDCPFEDAF